MVKETTFPLDDVGLEIAYGNSSENSSENYRFEEAQNFPSISIQQQLSVNNKSFSQDDDTYLYYGVTVVAILSALLVIIMITALIGNFLVITTILKNKYMRTRTNLLLCNLSVADFFTALLDIPVAIHTLNHGDWPYSKALCAFNGYLVGLGLMLSIHTLMWISIHKFISITRPLARSMTPGKILCMILAAWAWALLYNLGPVFGWTDIVYKKGASQCGPVIPVTAKQKSHSATNTIFNFVLPVCVMSYCYYKIFAEVKEHMNRLQDFSDTRILSTIMQQKRITKTLLIVFVCFIMCWFPYIVYSTLLVSLGQENVSAIFNPLAYLATYLNSACNPIIYALRSPSFRKGFEEILFCYDGVPARQPMLQAPTKKITLAPQPKFVFEDKPKVELPKVTCTAGSKSERSIGFREGRRSLTVSSRNQSVSSTSKCFDDAPTGKGSFRWSQRVNGVMVSFRRTLIRSRSSPDVTSFKNGQRRKLRHPKQSITSAEPPSLAYKPRRINTLPTRMVNDKNGLNLVIRPSSPQVNDKKHKGPSSRVNSVSSANSPKLSPLEKTSNLSSQTKSFLLTSEQCDTSSSQQINSVSPVTSPRPPLRPSLDDSAETLLSPNEESDVFTEFLPTNDKKYSIYFATFLNRPLSFSAPDILMNADFNYSNQTEEELTSTDNDYDENDICLEVPQITYSRTCSEGNVQPLSKPASPKLYRKEVPELLWQASLEDINVVGNSRLKGTKYRFRRQRREGSSSDTVSSRHLDARRPSAIQSILTSMECLISSIFSRGSAHTLDSQLNATDVERGGNALFYTQEEKNVEENEPDLIVSHL